MCETKKERLRKLREALRNNILSQEEFQRCPNTFVLLSVRVGDRIQQTYGFAKCRWPDPFKPKEGVELAKEKALAELAKMLYTSDNYVPVTNHDNEAYTVIRVGEQPALHAQV